MPTPPVFVEDPNPCIREQIDIYDLSTHLGEDFNNVEGFLLSRMQDEEQTSSPLKSIFSFLHKNIC
jgi:hypothetical protein